MASKRTFEIAFVGLKQGVHEFNYVVDDKFFVEKGEPDFTNCQANIKLQLDKKSSFLLLKFEIGGKAAITCDRCGNPLGMDIWDEFNMLVKLVDNPDEMNTSGSSSCVFISSGLSTSLSNMLNSSQMSMPSGFPHRSQVISALPPISNLSSIKLLFLSS